MSSEVGSAPVVAPGSVEELARVLAGASSRGSVVGVRGTGSKAGWAAPGAPADIVIDTRGLDRIGEHAAGDLVVTAQAGVTLAALQEHVAPARQWLALDPPEDGATLGGVIATAASGPRRLLYGTPRDLLIGITVVLADGTVAHSGGKVVKNVAGYDLGKLFTGSFGTLGVIAQATFRLHPLPVDRRVVRAEIGDPAAAVQSVRRCGAVPCAIEWDGTTLTVVIESLESAAQIQADAVAGVIGGQVSASLPAGFGDRPWRAGEVGVKITHRLGALREVLAVLASLLPGARLAAHAGSGVVWVGSPDTDLGGLGALRDAVARFDGQVVVVAAPDEVKRSVDVWGPVRGERIMRRIKEQFDPDRRMSPGVFIGGI
jgi:glycolate oxidase FAD binding subunit